MYLSESVRPDSESDNDEGDDDLSSYTLSFTHSHTSTPDLDQAQHHRGSNVDDILTKKTISKEILNESFRERSSNALTSSLPRLSRTRNLSKKKSSSISSGGSRSLRVSDENRRRSSPASIRQSRLDTGSHGNSLAADVSDSGSEDIPTIVVSEHQTGLVEKLTKSRTLPLQTTPPDEHKTTPTITTSTTDCQSEEQPHSVTFSLTKKKVKISEKQDSMESSRSIESWRSFDESSDIPIDIGADQSDTPPPSTPAAQMSRSSTLSSADGNLPTEPLPTDSQPTESQPTDSQPTDSLFDVSFSFDKKSEPQSDSSKESTPERVSKSRFSSLKSRAKTTPKATPNDMTTHSKGGSLPGLPSKRSTLMKIKTGTLERKTRASEPVIISSPVVLDKKPDTPDVLATENRAEERTSPIQWETEGDKVNAPPVPFRRITTRRNATRRHTAASVAKPRPPDAVPRKSLPMALGDDEDEDAPEREGNGHDKEEGESSSKDTDVAKEREEEQGPTKDIGMEEKGEDCFIGTDKEEGDFKDEKEDAVIEDKRAKARLAASRLRQVKERSTIATTTSSTGDDTGITSTAGTGITGFGIGTGEGELSRDEGDELLKHKREKARMAARRVRGNKLMSESRTQHINDN